ncbi:hypothetical protein [Mycobacterium sp.]|jgi:hypothetical protein|uniref:hypothetical protein n=1 Tax=Mycobacterium sp. TaxID=1785 RepID=UPI0028BE6E69|nr:hypothetical protein [Mycobacterium sp.]
MAQANGATELIAPMKFPSDVDDLTKLVKFMFDLVATLGIPLHEFLFFFERILAYLTACDERRLAELESQSWWEVHRNRHEPYARRRPRRGDVGAYGLRHLEPVAPGRRRHRRATGPRVERADE